MAKPINVVIKGDYNDRDINRAIRDLERLKSQSAVTGGALGSFQKGMVAAGGALAGAFSFGVVIDAMKDAAQAAMQDEKSMIALATAMDNVGLASQNAQAEGLIESMMLQTGIADDQLRPAFQKLVTVTKDVGEAQSLLQTALDVSAAGYGDLTSASKALSAAANGNFTALQRLKVPIDQGALAAKDFDAAVTSLNKVVGGQAAAAVDTYAGRMSRLTVAVGEAQEAIGYSLLSGLDRLMGKMGGVGGTQDVILKTGDTIALFVDGVVDSADRVGMLTLQLGRLTSLGLIPADKGFDTVEATIGVLKQQLMLLVGPLVTMSMYFEELGLYGVDAADGTKAMSSATVDAAVAAGQASSQVGALADDLEDAGNQAWYATKSYLAFYEGLVQSERAARDFANTSGTVSSALRKGAELGGSPIWEQLRQKYGELEESAGGAAGGVRELSAAQQAAADRAQALQQNTDSLAAALQGLAEEISPTIASAANATFELVNSQIEKLKSGIAEAKQYAEGIVSGFMGSFDWKDAIESASKSGKSIVEAFADQGKGIVEFGRKMKSLLSQGLSRAAFDDILRLGYARGMDAANALAEGNVAGNIAAVNEVYDSVKTMAEEVADAAKSAFYDAGLKMIYDLIRAMVEALDVGGKGHKRLMALMDSLAGAMNRTATVTVETIAGGSSGGSTATPELLREIPTAAGGMNGGSTATPAIFPTPASSAAGNFYGGIRLFAEGGIATRATPGIFGEAGPEALIPLDRLGDFGGGSTYNITVNAGVGDPRAIGKSVVEAITLFERSSGPVFARA